MEPFFREGIFIDELDHDMQRERRALRLRERRKQEKIDDETDDDRSVEKFTEDFGRKYRQDFGEKFAPESFGDDDDKPDAMQPDKIQAYDKHHILDRDDDRKRDDKDDKDKDRDVIRGAIRSSLGEVKGPIQEMPWDWLPDKFDPLDNAGFTTSPDNGSPVPYRLNGHPDLEKGRPWDKDGD